MKQTGQSEGLPYRKNWVSVRGIAGYCMVSRRTVRRWIKDEKLSAIKLPSGHYRVSLADFRDFLERYDMPFQEGLLGPNLEERR